MAVVPKRRTDSLNVNYDAIKNALKQTERKLNSSYYQSPVTPMAMSDVQKLEEENKKKKERYKQIRNRLHKLIGILSKKYDLEPYMDIRYQGKKLDNNKIIKSIYYERFSQKKDAHGNQLKYGFDYIPLTWEEYFNYYFPDIKEVLDIYEQFDMGGLSKDLTSEQMKTLNEIYKENASG